MKESQREALTAYVLLSPVFVGFIVFGLIPIVSSLFLSFTEWDLFTRPEFVGFDNFKRVVSDPVARITLKNTVAFILLNVPFGTLALPILLALLLNRGGKGVNVLRTIFFIPTVTLSVSAGFVWGLMLNPDFGIVNYLLSFLGVPPINWLINPDIALLSLTIVNLWKWVGYNMIIFLAALKGIPGTFYEAALIDGASKAQSFFKITIPFLMPTITFVTIIGLIGSFQFFDLAYIMTQGGPGNSTLVYNLNIYRNAFQYSKMGYASALSWILFAFIFLLTMVQMKLMSNKGVSYE